MSWRLNDPIDLVEGGKGDGHSAIPPLMRAAAARTAARMAAEADEDDPPPPVYLTMPVYPTTERGAPVCQTEMVINTMVSSKCAAALVLERPT